MKLRIKIKDQLLEYEMLKETITIGRSSECDFVIPLEDFSRRHCQLTKKGDYYFVMDLGSKNGVILDGRKIPHHQHFPVYRGMHLILANHFELLIFDEIPKKEKADLSLLRLK